LAGGVSQPVWSPDSKWLAYSEGLHSHFNVVSLYSLESGKSTQITDGLADAHNPIFDRDGKYLYFVASTHVGQAATLGDLSQFNNLNQEASLYAVMLKKGMPNPITDLSGPFLTKPNEIYDVSFAGLPPGRLTRWRCPPSGARRRARPRPPRRRSRTSRCAGARPS